MRSKFEKKVKHKMCKLSYRTTAKKKKGNESMDPHLVFVILE